MAEEEGSGVPYEVNLGSVSFDINRECLKIYGPNFRIPLNPEQYERLSRQEANCVEKGKRPRVVVKGLLEIRVVDTEI